MPTGGPYDLIHARMLLIHLPRGEQILAELTEALAPGGWLVVGDLTTPCGVVAAPRETDAQLFQRVQDISHHVVGPAGGISWDWAPRIDAQMSRAGLTDITAARRCWTATGGGLECRMHRNLNLQAHAHLLAAGLDEQELVRYRRLMLDPLFRAWFYEVWYVLGQKPAA